MKIDIPYKISNMQPIQLCHVEKYNIGISKKRIVTILCDMCTILCVVYSI